MTGKERVALMQRRRAREKARTIVLLILDIAITFALILGGLSIGDSTGITLLGAGAVLLAFNYLALLWSVPTMLRLHDSMPSLRKFLMWITGADRHKDCPRVEFFRCILLSLVLTAAAIYLLSRILG